jgi:hypothetical protein
MISEDGSEHKSENFYSNCERSESCNRRERRGIEQKAAEETKDLENIDGRLGSLLGALAGRAGQDGVAKPNIR